MKTTLDFLDSVKAKHGLTSDYQLAKLLECQPSAISNYRMGRSRLDDDAALKVADLLSIDPVFVLANIHAERAKTQEQKKIWSRVAKMVSGVSAAVFCAVILSAVDLPTDSMNGVALAGFTDSAGIRFMPHLVIAIFDC